MIATVSPNEESPTWGDAPAASVRNAPISANRTENEVSPAKKRVLLVDDEDTVTMLFQIALERTGCFQVRVENESTQAVATALEFQPDLIFLDWHMPDKEGVEIAAEFQAERSLQSVPIVFLTGAMSREEAREYSALGGRETITKPVAHQDFVEKALKLAGVES